MIVVLKRDDLPGQHRHREVESLQLAHFKLSPELIEQAELIVFAEGVVVKFLKHRRDIQSKESADVLLGYITSTEPLAKVHPPFSVKHFRHRRKKE